MVGRSMRCGGCKQVLQFDKQGIARLATKKNHHKNPAQINTVEQTDRQYDVWEGESQPLPSELLAAQPVYLPVTCGLCQTLMHATEDQIGQNLTCPDCTSQTIVKRPAPAKPVQKVLVPDGDEYQLDEKALPTETSKVMFSLFEKQHAARTESNPATNKQQYVSSSYRPTLPDWPLLTGWKTFFGCSRLIARWIALTAGLMLAVLPAFMSNYMLAQAGGPGMGGVGGAIGGMSMFVAAVIMSMIWFVIASPNLLAILVDSSDGLDRIENWPSNVFDTMTECFYLIVPTMFCVIPGWFIANAVSNLSLGMSLFVGGVCLLSFPVCLLSTLEIGSPLGVISPSVVRGIFRSLPSTAGVVLLSGLFFTLWASAMKLSVHMNSMLLFFVAIILGNALLFVYFRLLGRFAWKVSESGKVENMAEEAATE